MKGGKAGKGRSNSSVKHPPSAKRADGRADLPAGTKRGVTKRDWGAIDKDDDAPPSKAPTGQPATPRAPSRPHQADR